MSAGSAYVYRWLFFVVMMFGTGLAVAEEVADACQLSEIKNDFKQYLLNTGREQVIRIQEQLNAHNYGTIDTDGVLGQDTRLALQKFCQVTQPSDMQDGIAKTLIRLLEQPGVAGLANAETMTAPELEPKQEILSAPSVFYRWSPPETIVDDEASQGEIKAESDDIIPDDVLAQLAAIDGIAYPNLMLFNKALDALFIGSAPGYEAHLEKIVEQARIGPIKSVNKIQLSADDCGCSRDFSSIVYGFYPYWLPVKDTVHKLDFSLFDRIGFYALWLNQEGKIHNPLQWSDEWDAAAFINKARKYLVDVDVTVYASGWQAWSDKTMQVAVNATAQAAKQRFTSKGKEKTGGATPMFESSSSVQGDGVTVVFEKYTGATEMSRKITAFINALSEKLSTEKHDFKINIMLDMDLNAQKHKRAFSDLEVILLGSDAVPAKVEHLFVFLQAPTTDAKKNLRRIIEDQFRGAGRKQVLRKIVPVISAAGHDKDPRGAYSQFTDDLIYFQDNFAGVGLWPLPLDSDVGVETLKAKIVELYTDPDSENHISGWVDQLVPELCQFACPNRWLFRISFDLLVGLILVYALLAIWIYKLRRIYEQYFWFFLAVISVTVLIFLISLVCDPFWRARADMVMVALILVVVVITIGRYVSKATRPKLP